MRIVLPVLSALLCASVFQEGAAPNYQEHVFPIFQNHCLGCHNADKKKGDLDLSTYATAMAGGGGGEIAAAGDSAGSTLYKVVAHLDDPKMPPKKPKIPDPEIALIKKWIEGGLLDAPGGKSKKINKPKVDLALTASPKGKPEGPPPMPSHLLLEPVRKTARAEALTALAASPWAPLVAVAGQHQVLLYNSETLELLGILPYPERRPYALKFSRNGALLLAGGGRGARLGRVVVWDVKSGDRIFELGEEFDTVIAADLSADQSLIALGGPGKLVKVYSTKSGDLEHSIKKHTDWVTALEFSPDSARLASGDRNGGVHVWEAQTGRILYTLNGHKAGITDISWRSDSNVVATSSEDGQVMLWEMAGGTRVKAWAAHSAVASAEFTHDGRLVTCGRDMLVRAWDANGTKLRDFEAFTDLALQAVFSHDGNRVVAGDWTGEIRVWTTADGKRVGNLTTNPPTLVERIEADTKALAEARASKDKPAAPDPELARKKDAVAQAEGAAKKAADELRKLKESLATAKKTGGADEPGKAKIAGLQKSVTEKEAEAARAAETERKARAQAEKAAADAVVKAKQAPDPAQQIAMLEKRLAIWRAAQFNARFYAQKDVVTRLQAEYDALAQGSDKTKADKLKPTVDAAKAVLEQLRADYLKAKQ